MVSAKTELSFGLLTVLDEIIEPNRLFRVPSVAAASANVITENSPITHNVINICFDEHSKIAICTEKKRM